jgi:alanine racemase
LPEPACVASVRARIVLVREVPAGTTVGYGATYAATRRERWATVGLGYGDGLRRALSSRGHGIVAGRRVPIIGRISMDMVVVDITGIRNVEAGSPVTFLGTDGTERITLEEMAAVVGTNAYEILTGFTPRLPRIWSDAREASRGVRG